MPLAAIPAAISRSMPSLFTDAGVFAKSILIVLFIISVVSWAIMWDRTRLYLRLRAKGIALSRAVAARGFAACMREARKFLPSVEGAIVLEANR